MSNKFDPVAFAGELFSSLSNPQPTNSRGQQSRTTTNQSDAGSILKNILSLTSTVITDISNEPGPHDHEKDDMLVNTIQGTINKAIRAIDNLPQMTEDDEDNIRRTAAENDNIQPSKDKKKYTNLVFKDDCIEGYYTEDLDITAIHQHIKDWLNRSDDLTDLYKQLEECNIELTEQMNRVNRISIELRRNDIKNKIKDIENKYTLNNYIKSVDEIIESFKTLGPLYKIIKMSSSPNINNEENVFRSKLIDEYLTRASQFFKIHMSKHTELTKVCPSCNISLDNLSPVNDKLFCSSCYVEISAVMQNSYLTDGSRVNQVSRNNYANRQNFEISLYRYMGTYNIDIPHDMLTNLNKYFTRYEGDDNDQYDMNNIRNQEKNLQGQCGPFSISDMLEALGAIGYQDYYPDVNYICHLLWSWDLPNIDDIFSQIMDDYETSNEVYQEIKKDFDRESSLNTEYHKYRLLERNGHLCFPCDFKIIRTPEIFKRYEKIWNIICDKVGWSRPPPISYSVLSYSGKNED